MTSWDIRYREELQEMLEKLHWTQAMLGRATGYSVSTICSVLRGKRTPSITFILKTADALQVPVGLLLTTEKGKYINARIGE